jgi:hypothetical protein
MQVDLCCCTIVHPFYSYTIATSGITNTALNVNFLPIKCTFTMA